MQRGSAVFLLAILVQVLMREPGPSGVRGENGSLAPEGAFQKDRQLTFQGVGSCASTACHHGSGAPGSERNEYTIWSTRDPHSRAYALLAEDPARQIVQKLDGQKARPATENLLCLSCHVQPGLEAVPAKEKRLASPPRLLLADGVGCENCHGPAEKWLKAHYLDDWKQKKPEEKAALGFRQTKDLVVRAQVCMPCHVGEGNRDVNHDLIAAGHPRLRFEYSAYLTNLPKHWNETKDRGGRADFDARVWEIGQVVSMEAALKLLEHRATAPGKPWPELAEYDCFACHHVLKDAKWRRNPRYLKEQLPGSLPWGSWYYALSEVLAEHPPRAGLKVPTASLTELRKLMQEPYRDGVNDRVAKEARDAARQLEEWMPGLRRTTFDWKLPHLAKTLEERAQQDLGQSSWDHAAQLYLALAAQRPSGKGKDLVSTLWRNLEFPPRYESPRGFDPRRLTDKVKK